MRKELASLVSINIEAKPIMEEISVVIPTLGRNILESCLYWMAAGNTWPKEIIVVDQGNNSQVRAWLSKLSEVGMGTCYVPSQKRGRATGINSGLREVKTRFVAITDDDCFVDCEWLYRMVTCLKESPERIFTGRVEPAGNLDVTFCAVTSLSPRTYNHPQLRVHPLIGGNIGVSMESVRKIGDFDEHPSIYSAEDSDWGYRALRAGIIISYSPDILLYHFNWRDSDQRAIRYRDYSRSQGAFYGKYLFSGDLLIPLQALRDLIRGPIRWLRGIVKSDQDMIDRGEADSLELIRGILAGLRRRNA